MIALTETAQFCSSKMLTAWLRRGATVATPELLKSELDKLEFLRRHGADHLDLSRLPVGRRRMLAEIGRRSRRRTREVGTD
ncbi:hypothetical protein [Candidatus Mycobacterium methanotrophicum]|uniref:Uncharacterized protein n=1 Tax=Candidatus Mycobacterium methanotrophicum TaxID=2943498 RepID=A0ABY4QM02_9MYCO|nr:hypothetical protein [Candidatus Mycobacterium methanotrophicum]UQX12050.1 hypothetical protein M5I08_06855 [Candidatus Mycobacterium methanotrophicum]